MTHASDNAQAGPAPEPSPALDGGAADATRAPAWARRLAWLAIVGTTAVLLLFAQLTLAGMDGSAPLAGVSASGGATGGASPVAAEAAPAEPPPSPEEFAAQDPIPLTDATWRFFEDDREEDHYYDLVFEQDGSCAAEGDETVYDGRYTVFGNDVDVELLARETVATVTAKGRSGEVEYSILFAVERRGNTMRGTGVVDPRWVLGGYGGPQNKGRQVFSETVYARPLPDEATSQ